ncbi:MAG TPA: DUF5107 domain-containing protein, partial [Marmoricola sp.]|nr:DUF5107 domain-containing protein [Marmoricola sp.]
MTATLTVENITLPVAPIGPPNPLPLVVPVDLGIYEPDGSLPPEVETNMRFGRVANVFPYLRQDNYTRARELAPVNVAVLENPHLRATFALGYGGRLLSLVQKQTDNELLFRNPVMQPANLALRNAWIAGGVEWNIGVRGHSPHTSSPTYAGLVRTEHLGDVLRLWEYERIRRVVYQIDFALAPHDPMLVWRTRIRNVTNRSTAMYWWTNIAVPEKGTRVFAPANTGIRTSYDGRLERVDLTTNGYTRPSESRFAADLFYESESDRPWIAAIDEQGTGVAHVSSRELFGRKLFVWGGTRAGDQWNRWLATERAGRYAEIQAGLTTTQYEHLPMAPRAEWTWTEALAPVRTVPAAGSSDWATAVSAVAQDVERQLPAASIESIARSFRIHEDDDPVLLASGSTWFHAERLAASGTDRPPRLAGTPFTDAPDAETQYWHDLATGLHITPDTRTAPASYVAGDHWLELLQ